jgi:sigma-B regulation protein RsbU (phosphoserine phosphatase)
LFVTAFYGILDIETGLVKYCCAGHNHPFVLRSDGTVEEVVPPQGLAICLKDDFHFKTGHLQLNERDSIFVYSDGVNEAIDSERNEFGMENLKKCLESTAGSKPVEVVRDVLREVEQFSGGIDQSDDITMLTLQFLA